MVTLEDLREELAAQFATFQGTLQEEFEAWGLRTQDVIWEGFHQLDRNSTRTSGLVQRSSTARREGRVGSGGITLGSKSLSTITLDVMEHLPLEAPAPAAARARPRVSVQSEEAFVECEESMEFLTHHRRGYMAGKELQDDQRMTGAPSSQSPKRSGSGASAPSARDAGDWSAVADAAPAHPLAKVDDFLRGIVGNLYFDIVSTVMILINATLLGIQADSFAKSLVEEEPATFIVSERVFCALFSIELLLRLYVYRCKFLSVQGWQWNLFDTIVVCTQLVDVISEGILSLAAASPSSDGADLRSNMSFLRIHRLFRLVRIIRVLRAFRSFRELRTIIVSMFGTLRTLLWTMILLFLVIFVCAVAMTQIVSYHLVHAPSEERETLQHYWGSLAKAMLVLFQAISNGLDWENVLHPLTEHISPWLAVPVCAYIGFGVFALMNVVTGVFVESALESARKEQERFLLHTLHKLFRAADDDGSGDISWHEFQQKLDHPTMLMYFKTIDLDVAEAEDLFKLIDINDSGSIDAEEFVNGCIRLQGPAKAIDLATLMHEYHRGQRREAQRFRGIVKALGTLLGETLKRDAGDTAAGGHFHAPPEEHKTPLPPALDRRFMRAHALV